MTITLQPITDHSPWRQARECIGFQTWSCQVVWLWICTFDGSTWWSVHRLCGNQVVPSTWITYWGYTIWKVLYRVAYYFGLLVGKSYHTRQKDGYSLPTNDPTNNRINWIWMSKKIGLNWRFSYIAERLIFGPLVVYMLKP